jgi:hypothetical protein
LAVALAFIPLQPKAKLSPSAIKADFQKRWSVQLGPEQGKPEKDQISFSVGNDHVIIALMRVPFPQSDLEGPIATSVLWPKAAEELKGHTGHLIVTVLRQSDDPVDDSRMLTRVCTSVLATCPEAPGVYWGNATLLVPSKIFQEFATEIMPGMAPLHIWVDFRVGWTADGISSGFTSGMKALGHMEFETESARESPGDLRERFSSLAAYVLEHGPVIKDGDTVGEDEKERIRVVYAPSAFGHEGQVMRLEYSSVGQTAAPKKKSWW